MAAAFAAVAERRPVTFGYRSQGRRVDPWRLSYRKGQWYLSGFDHVRGEERLFRLDRVDGAIEGDGPRRVLRAPGGAGDGAARPLATRRRGERRS